MTKDEALKLALEALMYASYEDIEYDETCATKVLTARNAIKEALAQPEQEPVKMVAYNCTCGKTMKFESLHGVVAPQRTWVGLDWLPEHKCGLYLSHNEHRDVYETIEEFYDAKDFISQEEWHKAVKEDSVWVLQWYPNTPIGFNRIAASTLQAIEAKLKEKNT